MMEQIPEIRETLSTNHYGQGTSQVPANIGDALKKPAFNVWEMQSEEMLMLLEEMFHGLDLVTRFNMDTVTLRNFLSCIRNNYRENPFHNLRHAFCVTQMMYSVVSLCHLQDQLSPVDIVTLMVASLCHDLDHPGLNNTYQVNASTQLAQQYQNKSPLESHHCAIALEILCQPQSDIFSRTDPQESREILKGIAQLIMATDLIHHFTILKSLQDIEYFSLSNKEHVALVKKALIKFCDISNEVRPAEQAEIWADALMEEYFQQGDREKAEGLPVTPYMDRNTVSKAESQRSFISILLLPLCEALCKIFPQMNDWMLQPLREAKLRYERQIQAEEPGTCM